MPYRRAWLFIAALIGATVFAFWRSYFAILAESPLGFHIHGITSSLWMLLLLGQSWTPHHGRMAVHRRFGRMTFVALPLFAAGSMAVVHSMASGTVGGNPFYALWGAPLAFIDVLSFGAVLYAAGMALRHRRDVHLHAGYMLSTALPLVSPVFGRVFNQTVPGLIVRGPQDFPVFGWGVQLANLMAGVIAFWLWRRSRRGGRPWAVALAVVIIQMIGFELATNDSAWGTVFKSLADLPLVAMLLFGLIAGAAVIAAGWTMPARRRVVAG